MYNVVQSAVFPKLQPCAPKGLYFRTNSRVVLSFQKKEAIFETGGILRTNTYFNSISIGKIKKYTHLTHLSLSLSFRGKFKITWKVKSLQQSDRVVQEDVLASEELIAKEVVLPFWDNLTEGMLFFELHALEASVLFGFQYLTKDEPVQKVHLGLVITHFNRPKEVEKTALRLKEELLEDPYYEGRVQLIIVDNSRNLSLSLTNEKRVTVIPNRNLGGSGGFSRGLMYLRHADDFTHGLFMDDDASSEIESIRRTIFYLAYSGDPKLAIAGAMLREVQPYMQHENGGRFDGLCYPIKCYYNLLLTRDLLRNEQEEPIDYGAWWYFAFPLQTAKHLAFPYFVRGDDIGFSLANNFHIITVNGISSWQADFAHKAGPLQIYLDQRNQIMHFFHGIVKDNRKRKLLKATLTLFILNSLAYQYESARACTLAIYDVLKGPDFWRDNVDMNAKRAELLALTQQQKIRPIPEDLKKRAEKGVPTENLLTKITRLISLNGHLLPIVFFKKYPMWQYKHYGERLRELYRRKEAIFYTDLGGHQGVILRHSKREFFVGAVRHLVAVIRLFINLKQLKKVYQQSYEELTSESF